MNYRVRRALRRGVSHSKGQALFGHSSGGSIVLEGQELLLICLRSVSGRNGKGLIPFVRELWDSWRLDWVSVCGPGGTYDDGIPVRRMDSHL